MGDPSTAAADVVEPESATAPALRPGRAVARASPPERRTAGGGCSPSTASSAPLRGGRRRGGPRLARGAAGGGGRAVRPRAADALRPPRAVAAQRLQAAHRGGARGALPARCCARPRSTAIVSRCVRGIDSRGPARHQPRRAALRAPARWRCDGTVCLVDGFRVPPFEHEQRAVIDGDCRSAAIAAASVLAKVTRDRYMRRAAERHPEWDFDDQRRLLDARAPRGDRRRTASRRCTGCRSSRSPTTQLRLAELAPSSSERALDMIERDQRARWRRPSLRSRRSAGQAGAGGSQPFAPGATRARVGADAAVCLLRSSRAGPRGPRHPPARRVLTSQNTRALGSAATMSSSPCRQRQLRSTMGNPRARGALPRGARPWRQGSGEDRWWPVTACRGR